MKIEVSEVTPAIAANWLKHNHNVRQITPALVDQYVAMFRRGEYVETHQGIAFNGKGLIDGQHRLTALSRMPADFKVKMIVVRGLSEDASLAMDIGKKRTADVILGEDKMLVAVGRLFWILIEGKGTTITPQGLIPFVELFRRGFHDLSRHCNSSSKMWSSAPIRAAYCWIYLMKGDTDYAKSVYRALVLQRYQELPSVANSFVRSYLHGTVKASQAWDTFVKALRVFDPANADKKVLIVSNISPTLADVREKLKKIMERRAK